MKTIWMFLTTVICGIIGSTIGAYGAIKLFEMFGVWSVAIDLIIVCAIIAFIYYLIGIMMNKPVLDIAEYEEPEDTYDSELQ